MAVYKSNILVSQPYDLSITQQRILYFVLESIVQIYKISEDDFYEVNVKEYARLYDLSEKQAYKDINKAMLDLKNTNILIPQPDGAILAVSWLSAILYKTETCFLAIKWHRDIIPYISGFLSYDKDGTTRFKGNVTKIDVAIAKQSSFMTTRLYEILKKDEYLKSCYYSLEELQNLICKNPYNHYKHFKEKVLVPGMKEIKELTTLKVSFFEKKSGKKVVGIGFNFGENDDSQ